MLIFWTGQFFFYFCFVFWMQLGLHNDRMTVETKNYNVETKNKYLYSYLHRVWLFRLVCHQYYIWKNLYQKKTYQLCKTKGCAHRFRKVCRRFFCIFYIFFFAYSNIFWENQNQENLHIFVFFCFEFSCPNSSWPMQGFGEAGIGKNGMVYKNAYNKNEIFDKITNLVTNNLVESSSYRSTRNFFWFFFDFLKIFFENFFDEE